jgi:ABC-type glycerol-3-phosphate transport system substrate-binding protein
VSKTSSVRSSIVSRRRFLKLVGLGGGVVLIGACAAPPAPSPAPAGEAAPAPAAQEGAGATAEPIVFWTPGGSAVYCQNFNAISKAFAEEYPGLTVADAQCGAGDQNFLEVLLARVAAGNPPDTTIIWDSPVSLAVRGALEPLDDLMKASRYSQVEAWPPGVLASCQWQGKTYGLPTAAGTYAVYYNEALFESKGISAKREDFPKTWDEMRKLSKEFTVWEGDTLKSVGFPITMVGAVELNIFSALNGSQFYDATNNKFTIDSEQNVEMMQYFLDWLNEEYKGDINAVNNSANWGFYPDSNGRPPEFQNGKVAMLSDGFWVAGDMYGAEVKPEAARWNVAQYPVGPSGSGTKSGYWPNWMVIPKGAKRREDAFKYMDYMSAIGILTWFEAIPDMPTNKNVDINKLLPKKVAEMRGEEFARDVLMFFYKQLDVATPMWTSPVQNFANDQITRMIEQVYTKQATPKDALAEAQKACQAELEKVMKA